MTPTHRSVARWVFVLGLAGWAFLAQIETAQAQFFDPFSYFFSPQPRYVRPVYSRRAPRVAYRRRAVLVWAPYGREVLARLSAQGQTVVLLIDQTQVNERHQAVMVAVRLGGRALPLIWRVKETQGAIGFAEQRTALEAVARLLPTGIRPVLIGDRFYGSPDLIGWCCEQGWDWRLRLKQNLLVFEQGGETTLAACFDRGEHQLRDIELTEKRVRTNVAMVHEAGHPEPWIIALSQAPSVHTASHERDPVNLA